MTLRRCSEPKFIITEVLWLLLGYHKFLLLSIVMRIDAIFIDVLRQYEFEDDRRPVNEQPHHEDRCVFRVLLEQELVARDIPIGDWVAQRPFKDIVAFVAPDLKQVLATFVVQEDGRVDNLDQNGAEDSVFVVLTTRNHFVEFVERDGVHYLLHELLGCSALVIVQLVIPVMLLNLLQFCILQILFVLL